MDSQLHDLLLAYDGILRRSDLLAHISHHKLDTALRNGDLVRVLPGIYVQSVTNRLLAEAAARYAAPDGALSHTTALWLWGLLKEPPQPLHLTVAAARQPRGSTLVRAHRRSEPPVARLRRGLPVVRLEQALLESAPLLPRDQGRELLIRAVRERQTTGDFLAAELTRMPKLSGRRSLRRLIELLTIGCQSELELFGYERVFSHHSMPTLASQYQIQLRSGTIYLDLADPETRIGIELDGAEFHDGPLARERDRRRDVELATLGWVILRFSARRLREDPAGVRREVLAVVRARRAQLRAG
jgi:very-short-patch-repair endonuclease